MKRFSLILLLSTMIFVSSCKKDDDVTPTKTTSELLTATAWKMTSYTENGVNDLDDCEKDDIFEFNTNNTFVANPGSIKCYNDDETITSIYSISSDEKTLILNGETWTITSITENELVISSTEDNGDVYIVILGK